MGASERMEEERCIPGGARLEDLAHWASASGLLEGTDCITHGEYEGDEEGQRATRREEAGKDWTAGRRLEKGARGICTAKEQEEGKCMRFLLT